MVLRMNRKKLEYVAGAIFLIYMLLNIYHLTISSLLDNSKITSLKMDRLEPNVKDLREIEEYVNHPRQNYPVKIKTLLPNGEKKVDIVLTVDREEFIEAMDATLSGGYNGGEFTNNPLPTNTTFVIENRDACKGISDLRFVIYVHSNPINVEKREIIRTTWGSKNLFTTQITKLVFLVGTPENPEHQRIIDTEHKQYGDVVQGSFKEHYRNLTLKGIMGLKWVSHYCTQATHAIKADDDAFVNIFQLIKLIDGNLDKQWMLMCPLWKGHTMKIYREPTDCGKWCVKYSEFPGREFFPPYCAGLSYVIARDAIRELYEASFSTPFFWIDDVYVTGMLTPKVKHIQKVDILQHLGLNIGQANNQYLEQKDPVKLFLVHVSYKKDFLKLWNATLDRLDNEELARLGEDVFVTYPYLKNKTINTIPKVKVTKVPGLLSNMTPNPSFEQELLKARRTTRISRR